MHMDRNEMQRVGITGCRYKVAVKLLSKYYDLMTFVVTVVFSLCCALYLFTEDFDYVSVLAATDEDEIETVTNVVSKSQWNIHEMNVLIEFNLLVLMFIYLIDIVIHIVGYGVVYLKQMMIKFEILVTFIAAIVLICDLFIQRVNPRGIKRLILISVLYGKLSQIRMKRDHRRQLTRMEE